MTASTYSVTVEAPLHGHLDVTPRPAADGRYAAGSVLTLTARPDPGYAVDSTWYSTPGVYGQMHHEHLAGTLQVTVDQDKHVGASFIKASVLKDLMLTEDVVYAKPGVKSLKYDVFAPKGAHDLPLIIVIHGGGWIANDQKIMRELARDLARSGQFVVASLDYRWYGKGDGDASDNTVADLIDDVFGGIAHVMEHASQYGGDATHVGITGDSAGGHLAAVASLMTDRIGSRGFGKSPGVFEFMPSYLPAGKSVDQVRADMMAAIKSAAPSYGVFSAEHLYAHLPHAQLPEEWQSAVSPIAHIPPASERSVPQFIARGMLDTVVTDREVKAFVDALLHAGQRVDYLQVGGAGHAFFDWKPDEQTQVTFAKYGAPTAATLRAFFLSTLYVREATSGTH